MYIQPVQLFQDYARNPFSIVKLTCQTESHVQFFCETVKSSLFKIMYHLYYLITLVILGSHEQFQVVSLYGITEGKL